MTFAQLSPTQASVPLSLATFRAWLEHAAGVVTWRRREYGEPIDLFEQVAQRWSLTLGTKISPAQVALCLIDLKIARLSHDSRHLDSIADIAGYAGCLAEVAR
jgi:Domain of unknown function (DUF6378)